MDIHFFTYSYPIFTDWEILELGNWEISFLRQKITNRSGRANAISQFPNSKIPKFMRPPLFLLFIPLAAQAQTKTFTKADTLRGSITPERVWWDVTRYDITVTPDYNNKTISGSSSISYKVVSDNKG